MLTGATVDAIDKPFEASLEMVKAVAPMPATVAARPKGAYLVGPESYGTFRMVAELQKANVPLYRAGKGIRQSGRAEVRARNVGDSADRRGAADRRETREGARREHVGH